jgi:hypothetical protein
MCLENRGSDQQDDDAKVDDDTATDTALATVAGAVGDIVSGATIPAPLRKNAFKAFNQLCTALIDIPVASLEGIAAERRAETQGRIKVISTGADQIAAKMKVDPEYARAAVKKFGQRILREQINLDQISQAAARELGGKGMEDAGNAPEPPPIDDDWLNSFEKEASQRSTEEMQAMFARILAGEIRKPSTFSVKTIKLLGQLDTRPASLFRKLCSLCVSLRVAGRVIDARVVALGGNAASNSLRSHGLSFDNLNVLHEYGLIIPDYNSWREYRPSIAVNNQVSLPFTYQKGLWAFEPTAERQAQQELRLHGVALSRSGIELMDVVETEPDDKYTEELQSYFATQHVKMTPVSKPEDEQPGRSFTE